MSAIFLLYVKNTLHASKNGTKFCRRGVCVCALEGGSMVILFLWNCYIQHFQRHISSDFIETFEATICTLSIFPSPQITEVLYQKKQNHSVFGCLNLL